MKIEIDKNERVALKKIYDRYYFGVFEGIRTSEEEEYELRNALASIVGKINEELESDTNHEQ